MQSERLKTNYPEYLARALTKWLPTHGYRYSTELGVELDIPRAAIQNIMRGFHSSIVESAKGNPGFDTRIFYARLHLWTDLPEANPRNIPDRVILLPKGGEKRKARNFTEEEYQNWLQSPEAAQLLARKNERFKRETLLAEQEIPQPASRETVGEFIGTFIDGMIRKGATQIADILSERQTDLASVQFRGLEDRLGNLEEILAKIVVQMRLGQPIQPTQPQQRTSRVNPADIGHMSIRLRELLDAYKSGTSEDRDKLMATYGKELMALDIVVHTLTRRPDEREENLKLTREINL